MDDFEKELLNSLREVKKSLENNNSNEVSDEEVDKFIADLGKYILEERKNKRVTQGRMSKLTKASQATLSNVENGKQVATIQLLMKISRALDKELKIEFVKGGNNENF